ncbi:hypothetical protein NP493_743g03006 [Ridgeia piscesae]|uniref:Lipoxygenase n=1 Tax=Ridgeia piscesae TaxID=27915 RepID=A0AAD9KPB2_RIDPI|nr:hypothetical protein NP493_743g03006 [Ridgeia piscesae]
MIDADEDHWVNRADELFREWTGEDIWAKRKAQQFQDAFGGDGSGSGLFSALGDKLKSLVRSNALAQNGYSCCPRPVGGLGFAKVVSNPKFPEHEFFRAGRVFCLRLRHNNLAFEDDAMLDGRVTCIKFCDRDQGGPLDLILHTGRQAQFYNGASFAEFLEAFRGGSTTLRDWTFTKPANYCGRVETVRRTPASYYDQRYYSHVTYDFHSVDGTHLLARLRLLPADGSVETGRPNKSDQKNIWVTSRLESEKRSMDYLRNDYSDTLRDSTLLYRLQIQLYNGPADDTNLPTDETSPFNASVTWDAIVCPWLDLAMISLVLPLCEDRLARTRMSLVTCPASFTPAEPRSSQDFRSVSNVLKEFHGVVANAEKKTPEEEDAGDLATCDVSVTTGKLVNAGTDGDIYITITGTLGRTAPLYLSHTLQDDFEPGHTDVFTLQYTDVGEFVAVHMELRSMLPGRHWYLERVVLEEATAQGRRHVFPCYTWLDAGRPEILLRKIDAVLPQHELSAYTYLQRKYELEVRRQLYQWDLSDSLPGRIKADSYDDLPREAQFNFQHELDVMGNYVRTLANTGAGTMLTMFDSWDPLADCTKLLTNVLKDKKTVRKVAATWRSDEEFGRQILNGPNPTRLRRIRKIPDNMSVTAAMLDRFADRGCSFLDEIEAGRVYFLSYPELEVLEQCTNYKGKYDQYITCPSCLLYVRRDGHLVPVAIQLHPGTVHPVWTPADSSTDWLFAKMWVREADAQIHQVMSRHLQTRLVMEVFAVATLRNLPPVHPLYKLLFPHLRYCIAINVLGRRLIQAPDDGLLQKLLATGGQHAQLVQRCYKSFHFNDLHLPTDLKERGVADARCLPGYFYRDDSLALWDVIKKFVRVVLTLHYWTEANVQADNEVQEWIADIYDNGFGGEHGLPGVFSRLDDLIDFVTTIIFTTSCRNAALTFGMMDYYAYCPNMPTMLLVAPPSEKGQTTMDTIKSALPSRGKTAEIIAACYTLSRRGKDEMFLGEFDEMHFDSAAMRAAVAAFQEDLRRVQRAIIQRNDGLDVPYTYLMPDSIPKTISA